MPATTFANKTRMGRPLLGLLVVLLLGACSDDSGGGGPEAGPVDAGLDGAAGGDGGGNLGVSKLVAAAIAANCSAPTLVPLAKAQPAEVRQAVVQFDKQAKLKHAPGYAYHNPLKADIQVPEVKKYAGDFTYTVYVPATYTADPQAPTALWIDPSHPTDKIKDDTYLSYLSKSGGGKFLLVRVNFMNILYSKMDKATYSSLGTKGVAFDQDYFNVLDSAIAAVKRRYHVDPKKVFISGVSAKGASSWYHGIFAADQYAAIHPVSIIPTDFDKALYLNLLNVGVYVWQGDADTVTPISKVGPMITKIKGYGLKVFYYVQKGGGHGTGWYPSTYMPLLLKAYSRDVTPRRVHKGIKTARNTGAYWLAATKFTAQLPPEGNKASAPPALMDATWTGSQVVLSELKGISEVQIRWLADKAGGPGRGSAGDKLSVLMGGAVKGPYTLQEHPTIGLEDYCRNGDTSRLWAGRVVVVAP